MTYGDSINVSSKVYNTLHHSRLVDHSFVINSKQDVPYMKNVLNYAVKKTNSPAVFGKDVIEISTSSRSQYKFIRNALNALKAIYKVK